MRRFLQRSRIEVPAEELYAWHERPGAFERLAPPWERIRVITRSGGIHDGDRVVLELSAGLTRMRWSLEHRGGQSRRGFEDVQLSGPFKRWKHAHRFIPDGPGGSVLEDEIEYAMPLGPAGDLIAGPVIDRKLARLFAYRHRITRDDLAAHRAARCDRSMRILVSGATGLIGSALVPFLTTGGHRVTRLSRSEGSGTIAGSQRTQPAPERAVHWDPGRGTIDTAGLEGLDAVVHLAAESIGSGPWTAARKERILKSRVHGTRLLCEALAKQRNRPRVLVSASAIGFYGDCGLSVVDEGSPPGRGFLAGVCREWEAATKPAEKAGIRVVHLRNALVLTPAGGALAKMLPPFRLGAGGSFGNGRQIMSWIGIDDLLYLILHAITCEALSGAVNAATPNPVTNRQFANVLGRVIRRPSVLSVPAWALRLMLGEMARETILASASVSPVRAVESGFVFGEPDLEGALRRMFGRMIAL